jgi:hypothetical protein
MAGAPLSVALQFSVIVPSSPLSPLPMPAPPSLPVAVISPPLTVIVPPAPS